MDQIFANSLSVLRTTPKRWEDLAACVAGEVIRMPPAPGGIWRRARP